MYLDHFGLERPPFKITPDPRLFFSGGKRGAVLDALVYTITSGEGITKVVGEVGSGKTMLCRMLETRLPDNVEIVYIANPSLSPENILQVIAFELKLAGGDGGGAGKLQAMQTLQGWLLRQHGAGKQVVVFIEEAQGMPLATLEEIRLLSNLETDQSKLLQIVMFGQPELDRNLSRAEIRQLRERIGHSFFLTPLRGRDVHEYLNFRMRSAGYRGPDIFSRACARLVTRYSRGLVRRVNIIADKALLAAFAENTTRLRRAHVRRAALDSAYTRPWRERWLPVTLAVSAAVVLALAAPPLYQRWHTTRSPLADAEPAPAAAQSQSAAGAPAVNTARSAASAGELQLAPAPAAAPRSAAAQATASEHALNRDAPSQDSLTRRSPAAPGSGEDAAAPGEHTLQAWLAAAQTWLSAAPRQSFSIQLLTVAQADSERLQSDLRKLSADLELDKIYIYETEINQNPMLGVLYNEYRTRGEALAAIDSLPAVLRQNRPFLRTVGGLRADIEG